MRNVLFGFSCALIIVSGSSGLASDVISYRPFPDIVCLFDPFDEKGNESVCQMWGTDGAPFSLQVFGNGRISLGVGMPMTSADADGTHCELRAEREVVSGVSQGPLYPTCVFEDDAAMSAVTTMTQGSPIFVRRDNRTKVVTLSDRKLIDQLGEASLTYTGNDAIAVISD